MTIGERWHRFGYWLAKRSFKNYIRLEESYEFSLGITAKKILLCMPDYSNQVLDAIDTIQYARSYFPDCELKVIFYESIQANIPTEYRGAGMMTKSSFDWFGIPNRNFIETIRQERCDLAIDLACPTNEINDLLCLTSGCRWHANLEFQGMESNFHSSGNIRVVAKRDTSREQQYKTLFRYLSNLQKFNRNHPKG